MNALGLYDAFLALSHQETWLPSGEIGDLTILLADLAHLPKATQRVQFFIQNHVISAVQSSHTSKLVPPWFVHLFIYIPWLRRWPARIIGLRPEHARSRTVSGVAY
ncbi:hypothetical protein MHY1_02116 [Methylovirgula sp. HY1]|nr:hypothetical protein MHY1_02116 [Methylovirgula sp. HY1]